MNYDDAGICQHLGEVFKAARIQRRISITQCAAWLRTTRRRYADIESGKTELGIVELERLCQMLEIPPLSLFPHWEPRRVRRVRFRPDELLELIPEVDGVSSEANRHEDDRQSARDAEAHRELEPTPRSVIRY